MCLNHGEKRIYKINVSVCLEFCNHLKDTLYAWVAVMFCVERDHNISFTKSYGFWSGISLKPTNNSVELG